MTRAALLDVIVRSSGSGPLCCFLLLVLKEQLPELQAALLASILDMEEYKKGYASCSGPPSPLEWADGLLLLHSLPPPLDQRLLQLLGCSTVTLPSFLPSFLLAFLPSFPPFFLPAFLPSPLPSFLGSFFVSPFLFCFTPVPSFCPRVLEEVQSGEEQPERQDVRPEHSRSAASLHQVKHDALHHTYIIGQELTAIIACDLSVSILPSARALQVDPVSGVTLQRPHRGDEGGSGLPGRRRVPQRCHHRLLPQVSLSDEKKGKISAFE